MYPFWDPQLLLGRVPSGLIDYEQDAFFLFPAPTSLAKFSSAKENTSALTVGRINQWTSPLLGRAKA